MLFYEIVLLIKAYDVQPSSTADPVLLIGLIV